MFQWGMDGHDSEACSVGGTVQDRGVCGILKYLFASERNGSVAGTFDFVFPTKDFRGRKQVAEFTDDFRSWNQLGEEIAIASAELA